MKTFVDLPAVRWDLPAADQLVEALCELFPEREAAMARAAKVDVKRWELREDLTLYFLWRRILEIAAPRGKLRPLVEQVLEDNPGSVRADFLRALLTDPPETVAVDARPPRRGDSTLLAGDDTISRHEALLFHDDLSLKIGRLPWLLHALDKVASHASGVCKIEARGPAGTQYGTGFLVAPGLVMTNWHVVGAGNDMVYQLRTLFGYDDDGGDGTLTPMAINADMDSIDGDAADDWAVFRLAGEPPPGAAVVRLSEAAAPVEGEAAFIIQHPGGETKRIAYARNTITRADDRLVHYLSDTRAGSSGSPVFNDQGRIVALHHAGGQPQQVAGKQPLIKNEGIRIERIIAQMRQKGLETA